MGQKLVGPDFRKMRFTVRESHFSADSLVVKCNANIGEAYWQVTTESPPAAINLDSNI